MGNFGSRLMLAVVLACVGATSGFAQGRAKRGDPLDYDSSAKTPLAGVGIEARDIARMTDEMMRDLLTVPELAGRATPPRIIVDSQFFRNMSSQPINKDIITDRLRVNLSRASQGKMRFVSRENADMVASERELKREGVTDVGTTGLTKAVSGADYRLAGKIESADRADQKGKVGRFTQIIFELVDLESGEIVWTNLYEMNRVATENLVYQ